MCCLDRDHTHVLIKKRGDAFSRVKANSNGEGRISRAFSFDFDNIIDDTISKVSESRTSNHENLGGMSRCNIDSSCSRVYVQLDCLALPEYYTSVVDIAIILFTAKSTSS